MRVTMVNKYYPPHIGGVEFHVRDLAEGLVEHRGLGVRALVCANSPEGVTEVVNGVDVERLPRAFEYASTPVSWQFASALRAEPRREPPAARPQLLHFHFPYPWGELAWLRAKPPLPLVVTYHSDIVRQKTQLAAYRPFLERFLDAADLIVTGSPDMIEHSDFLAPRAQKCRVVDYGIHTERYAEAPELLARAAELRAPFGERPVVLFVGRLVYYKGADVLVRAFAEASAAARVRGRRAPQLVMIGHGPLEAELREIAASTGLADHVSFVAGVDDTELAAWYHAADVFVLPSVARSEAFGLVQIEAHSAGLPVVSTNLTTGVPYANLDGVTGLTVPVNDSHALAAAISRLLDDDELRARLGRQARERALTQFTIPAMCDAVMEAYGEAMQRHAARTRSRR